MRLNKKKLAALAMSAVMAASTMPFPVLAEELDGFISDSEITAEEETTEVAEYATTDEEIDANDNYQVIGYPVISYNASTDKVDFKFTLMNLEGVGGTGVATATRTLSVTPEVVKKATCSEVGKVKGKVTYKGSTYESGELETSKLNHDLNYDGEKDPHVVKPATCEEKGTGVYYYKCNNCGEWVKSTRSEDQYEIEKASHTYDEKDVVRYVAEGTNVKIDTETGLPELIDKTKNGSYHAVYKCTVCENEVNGPSIPMYGSTKITVKKVEIVKGIVTPADTLKDEVKTDKAEPYIPEEKIELTKCNEPGQYKIFYTLSTDPDNEYYRTVDVSAPHHYNTQKIALFDTQKDADKCYINDKGVVINKNCTDSVTYTEVTVCNAAGCTGDKFADVAKGKFRCENSTVTGRVIDVQPGKVATATNHEISAETKSAVAKLVNGGKVKYEKLKELETTYKGLVKISDRQDCEKAEEITVSYICKMDRKTVVSTETVTVVAEPHNPNTASELDQTTYVEPTCEKAGSIDSVIKCTVCGKEMSRETKELPRRPHSNEQVVATSGAIENDTIHGSGAYLKDNDATVIVDLAGSLLDKVNKEVNWFGVNGFNASFNAYTNCKECGNHEVKLTGGNLKVKLVDIKKQNGSGDAGSVTFEVTYTKDLRSLSAEDQKKEEKTITKKFTYDYFSTMVAYLDRNPEKDPLDGLVKDEYGVWRYYKDGEFQKDYVGIVEYNGGQFFVADGVLCSKASGLNQNVDGEWYFLAGGQIQTQANGLVPYNGEWFFLTNGKLDRSKTGLVEYDGAKFIVYRGELQRYSGLWQDPADGTWYFAALGQIQEQYTGTAIYDGQTFELVNGKLVR